MERLSGRSIAVLAILGWLGAGPGVSQEVNRLSADGTVQLWHDRLSSEVLHDYLNRLGLTSDAVPGAEAAAEGADRYNGRAELFTEWASFSLIVDTPYRSRESYRIFDQTMRVERELTPDGVRVTDDWGGSRLEVERKFPVASCDRGTEGGAICEQPFLDHAEDDMGVIVEFLRDRHGYPKAVRLGDVLLLRYFFDSEPVHRESELWRLPRAWDLVDLRTDEIILTSDVGEKLAVAPARFSVAAGAASHAPDSGLHGGVDKLLIFAVHGQLYGVVGGSGIVSGASAARQKRYALLPLEDGDRLWRSINAKGDYAGLAYEVRVDYTDDSVRAEIQASDYRSSLVVEAPRAMLSQDPVRLIQPDMDLPRPIKPDPEAPRIDPRSEFPSDRLPIVSSPAHPGIRALLPDLQTIESAIHARTRGVAGQTSPQAPPGCELDQDGNVTSCEGEEITVTPPRQPPPFPSPTPLPTPPPPPLTPLPSPPLPPPSEFESNEEKLASALEDARQKAAERRCRLPWRLRGRLYEARSVIGTVVDGGPECSYESRPFAHVDAIGGSTIYICPRFYNRAAEDRTLILLHEGFHIAGVRHLYFGKTQEEGSSEMNRLIRQNCM